MKNKGLFTWLLVGVLVLLVGGWAINQRGRSEVSATQILAPLVEGDSIPDLNFPAFDGGVLTANDLDGKVVIINAFASWCGPCLIETPELVKFYNENQDKIVMIGLNVGEDETAVQNYQLQFGVPYPLVLDPDGDFARAYRPRGLPTSWFIDRQGVVQNIHSGPMTLELIEQIVDAIN